jgi:EAL domain-containing protein (putative c-di-GMP-specific phosphodiesterase class I)
MNFVKIDKSFIDRIATSAEGSAMVRGVIDLSRALGFSCIAEGVEQEIQRTILDGLGCDSVQGYLFGRPEPGADVVEDFKRLMLGQTSLTLSSTLSI